MYAQRYNHTAQLTNDQNTYFLPLQELKEHMNFMKTTPLNKIEEDLLIWKRFLCTERTIIVIMWEAVEKQVCCFNQWTISFAYQSTSRQVLVDKGAIDISKNTIMNFKIH